MSLAEAKESLKRILIEHNGDPSQPAVQEAISALQNLAEQQRQEKAKSIKETGHDAEDNSASAEIEWDATKDPKAHTGKWRMISAPTFPGRLPDTDGKARFTLGRMAFNMFKPTKIVCCVDEIFNVIEPLAGEPDDAKSGDDEQEWVQSYNFEVIMEIERPNKGDDNTAPIKLPAKLINHATCTPGSPTRLSVKFTGGILKPNFDLDAPEHNQMTTAWKQIFEGAITKEAESQSIFQKLKSGASNALMSLIMGLIPPVDTEELTQTYSIARPIAGHLDMLYLDEDLRISKGNRGTIVVVERV